MLVCTFKYEKEERWQYKEANKLFYMNGMVLSSTSTTIINIIVITITIQ